MHPTDELERHQREEARWRLLFAAYHSTPMAIGETVLWRTITDLAIPCTPRDIRRELTFLERSGLISISGQNRERWSVELTAAGINVVEYTIDAPAGITRPPR